MTRSVFITGGSRGIGFSAAQLFLEAGYRVAVCSRGGEPGPEGALAVRADVGDMDSLKVALEEVGQTQGPPEIIVANAGITRDMLLLRMKESDFTEVINVNLTGAFRAIKLGIKPMLRKRFGRIILISSVSGYTGMAGQINYSASKSAMIGLARALTREFGSRGITTNVVVPGVIRTEMTAKLSEETLEDYRGRIPLGRFGRPEDVAEAVLWLASDQAAYVSGAVLPVDGGLAMGH